VPLGKGALGLKIGAIGKARRCGLHVRSCHVRPCPNDVTGGRLQCKQCRCRAILGDGLQCLTADARTVHGCVLRLPATGASGGGRPSSTPSSWAWRAS
jgi:hypothetical protein